MCLTLISLSLLKIISVGMLPIARPHAVLFVFAMHYGIAKGQTTHFLLLKYLYYLNFERKSLIFANMSVILIDRRNCCRRR